LQVKILSRPPNETRSRRRVMNWIIFSLLYLAAGAGIVGFIMRPDKSFRVLLDERIEKAGGLNAGPVALVVLVWVVCPLYVLVLLCILPFAGLKKKREMRDRVKYHVAYRKMMGYSEQSVGICELCHRPYAHVHHVAFKGMGGNKALDTTYNLIGLCPACHDKCHGADWKAMKVRCLEAIKRREKYFRKKAK